MSLGLERRRQAAPEPPSRGQAAAEKMKSYSAEAVEARRHAEKQMQLPAADFPRTRDETHRFLYELQLHQVRREIVDLSAMAIAVAAELKLAQPESRVAFHTAQGLTGNGDAGLCRIILDKLIGNAWRQGVNREGAVIEFGMTELGGKAVCFVCDNGPGFDMADAGQLFIPFQQLPDIDVVGRGVGLALVKWIVMRYGGRVWAESSPGEGATFFFTLE